MASFEKRDDSYSVENHTIILNPVDAYTWLLHHDKLPTEMTHDSMLSAAFWVLNEATAHNVVKYRKASDRITTQSTPEAYQAVCFTGLVVLMGFVMDVTKNNALKGIKRWKAGLKAKNKTDLLTDSLTTAIWKHLAANKTRVYDSFEIRKTLLTTYLYRSRVGEGALILGILEQIDLVYENAYLNSIMMIRDFITSGSRAIEIPSVAKEARIFYMYLEEALAEEMGWDNFAKCRLIDRNKYPKINYTEYPHLYTAVVEWAKVNHRLPNNYRVSKSIISKVSDRETIKSIVNLEYLKRAVPVLTEADTEWLEKINHNIEDNIYEYLVRESKRREQQLSTSPKRKRES